jgi:hypothetical protein
MNAPPEDEIRPMRGVLVAFALAIPFDLALVGSLLALVL